MGLQNEARFNQLCWLNLAEPAPQAGASDFRVGVQKKSAKILTMVDGSKKSDNRELMQDKQKKEYVTYICENTPWFLYDFVLCMKYLPNINQLATGDYHKRIKLWDLR